MRVMHEFYRVIHIHPHVSHLNVEHSPPHKIKKSRAVTGLPSVAEEVQWDLVALGSTLTRAPFQQPEISAVAMAMVFALIHTNSGG